MEHERWRRVEALYHSALNLPAAQRFAFLENSCGTDKALLDEIESLLTRQTSAQEFMAVPAFELAAQQIAQRKNQDDTDQLTEEFVPGNLLANRYRIVTLLGRGGMGAVYRADDLDLGQIVALKFLLRAYSQDARRLERFRAEVRNARQISHPSVCRVYDIHEADRLQFLTMEYIDGEDLSSLLRRIGHLPQNKALQIARQLCAGLAAAHERGVLHRDLKPANIMIDGHGHARITDFGLAVNFDDARELRETAGTPAYMAPEQLDGKPATVKSDLYSLGLVLYELYTGKTVFDATGLEDWKRTVSQFNLVPPSARVENIDVKVERAILQCLEQDPQRRPSSALKIAAALPGGDLLAETIAAGETPSPEMVAAAEGPALRVGAAWAALVGVALLLISLTLISYRSTFQGLSPVGKDREVLVEDAQKIIRKAGYTRPFADHAYDYGYNERQIAYWAAKEPHNLVQALQKFPGGRYFWYREEPTQFRPVAPLGTVTFNAPPLQAGSVRVWLTSRGELWNFQAIPGPLEPETSTESKQVDWPSLFGETGLPFTAFHQVAPTSPPVPFDSQVAWEGIIDGESWRVQGASLGGRLVSFNIQGPWTSTRVGIGPFTIFSGTFADVANAIRIIAILVILGLGSVLAHRNLRGGRGDRKGARWVFLTLLSVGTLESVGGQHPPASLNDALGITMIEGVGGGLFLSILAWVGYLAIEPFARKHWPQLLVSWSRIIAGGYRSPIVGRDILLGLMAGCGAGLIVHILHTLPPLAAPLNNGYPFFLTTGTLTAVGWFANVLRGALTFAFGMTFFLVVLRKLLRSEWAAMVLVALLLSLTDPGIATGNWLLIYLTGFLAAMICVIAGARLGLVAFIIALFAKDTFILLFTVIRWSDWNVARPLLLLGFFAALAIYGFRIAVARPMLTTALDE